MIYTPLMPHQLDALKFVRTRPMCGLFMFPGSGKSLVSLKYADEIKAKRILITSDKNCIFNTWPDQILSHSDFDYVTRPDDISILDKYDRVCVLVNYDYLTRHWERYAQVPWDLWIADESAEFKDQRTDRFRYLRHMVADIPRRVLLNGKLMTERLEDVFGQMMLIGGEKFLARSITQFRVKYMQPDPSGYGWTPRRSSFTDVQKAIEHVSYFLEDDGTIKMPTKEYFVVHVEQTEEQRRIDDELRRTFASSVAGVRVEVSHAAVLYQKRVQLCGGILRGSEEDKSWAYVPTNKTKVLLDVITQNPSAKFVVWHTYIPETEVLSQLIRTVPSVATFVMQDATDTKVLLAFAKARSPAVLLIRTSLCKGLNHLADADIAVFYSNPFSYARRVQAEGRTRRISSKTRSTKYLDIITKGGADEQVYSMLSRKTSVSMTWRMLKKLVDVT